MVKKKNRKKSYSPFKDINELKKEVTIFINKYKTIVYNQASRLTDYFEMCCFNYVVDFYKINGFKIEVKNLQDEKYRYKCTTQGNQENFSFFEVKKRKNVFEVHHNLAVQSCHQKDIYTTPDITVVKNNKLKKDYNHYSGAKVLSFIKNVDLVTFCEVKQFTPFPELVFNFIGTVNELKRKLLSNRKLKNNTLFHIAPSLLISGKANNHLKKIKESLEKRYKVNILYDIFYYGSFVFSKRNKKNFRTI